MFSTSNYNSLTSTKVKVFEPGAPDHFSCVARAG